ncbi:MAG: Transcription elongation factor GreA [Candidatus Jorgensenbacteria bacterium GW2011_GWB1_49_9]|nr:MAG: Transcription elongation factor GreA [Candidatus Jorgensenbacteria bacterium GW2011_GWB1_49_9]
MDITYLSQERFDELSRELQELKTKGRQEIAQRLKQAKELGDLSENSEYQEAREEQNRLEQKIAEVDDLLKHSSIIKKPVGTATVRIGSKVKVKKDRETVTYSIVGSNEADPAQGFVSNESPLGRGLLGHKVGDFIFIKAPKGEIGYQILAID